MFNTNPFREHRAKEEVLKEDPAHYAAIARNNAANQAKKDKADPEAAKKREKAKAASDKRFTKNPLTPGNTADSRNPTGSMVGTRESIGQTAGDHGYYHLQKAKELAKKDGHDYDKLPQYDRTHDKHKDHYDSRAKKESVKSENTSFKEKLYAMYATEAIKKKAGIEDGPDEEQRDRTKAKNEIYTVSKASRKPRKPAVASLQNKDLDAARKERMQKQRAIALRMGEGLDAVQPKELKKKFKDREDKDIDNDGDTDSSDKYLHKRRKKVSKAINQKEEINMSIKDKLWAFLEASRADKYKSATAPEGLNDKSKSSKGAMDMLNTPKEIVIDEPEMDKKTLANLTKGVPARKTRKGDNPKGDNKIIPSATKAESYVRPNSMDSMINAVNQVTEKARTIRTNKVKSDHSMNDQHAQTGFGMSGKQTYAGMHGMNKLHYSKYISKKSGHDSYFDGHDLVHSKSSKTVVPNALHGKHTPDQLADKMKAHGDKHVTSGASIVEDMDKVHTVDIDHTTGEAGSHEKKHGITLKKNGSTSSSSLTTDATGTKANLQKYLKKHYDGDHEEMHPEIYK